MIPRSFFFTLALGTLPSLAAAQDFHWEGSLAAGKQVSIQEINGDIRVAPSTSGKIEIVGTKKGDRGDFSHVKAEVHETARGIIVCVVFDGMTCTDSGMKGDHHGREDMHARMDLAIALPPNLSVSAASVSGDVAISGAQGSVAATTVSGDVTLGHLRSGAVSGTTVSGDVAAQIDELTGTGDLRFTTVSGDVELGLPRQLDADLSMRTVSGEINSDFPLTVSGSLVGHSVNARIGKGGRKLSLTTVSGDARLKANE